MLAELDDKREAYVTEADDSNGGHWGKVLWIN
jgi:hypothetical protein